LLIGIKTLLFLILFARCENEYVVNADFVYTNETDFRLSYNQIALDTSDTTKLFDIEPNAEVVIKVNGEGEKRATVENCCGGFLGDIQGTGFPILIVFNESKCITYLEGEGSTTSNIAEYESKSISNNHFQFTYRFTIEKYNEALDCNYI